MDRTDRIEGIKAKHNSKAEMAKIIVDQGDALTRAENLLAATEDELRAEKNRRWKEEGKSHTLLSEKSQAINRAHETIAQRDKRIAYLEGFIACYKSAKQPWASKPVLPNDYS